MLSQMETTNLFATTLHKKKTYENSIYELRNIQPRVFMAVKSLEIHGKSVNFLMA